MADMRGLRCNELPRYETPGTGPAGAALPARSRERRLLLAGSPPRVTNSADDGFGLLDSHAGRG